jgi:hypothetical protein
MPHAAQLRTVRAYFTLTQAELAVWLGLSRGLLALVETDLSSCLPTPAPGCVSGWQPWPKPKSKPGWPRLPKPPSPGQPHPLVPPQCGPAWLSAITRPSAWVSSRPPCELRTALLPVAWPPARSCWLLCLLPPRKHPTPWHCAAAGWPACSKPPLMPCYPKPRAAR